MRRWMSYQEPMPDMGSPSCGWEGRVRFRCSLIERCVVTGCRVRCRYRALGYAASILARPASLRILSGDFSTATRGTNRSSRTSRPSAPDQSSRSRSQARAADKDSGVCSPNSNSATARTNPGLRWVTPRSIQYRGNEASNSRMVSHQNSLSSGRPARSGCWPIIVVTTEKYDRAVASTNMGENRLASRGGGLGCSLKLVGLRDHYRAACTIGAHCLHQQVDVMRDETIAQIKQPFAAVFAVGPSGLKVQLRTIALFEGLQGLLQMAEQSLVAFRGQPAQGCPILFDSFHTACEATHGLQFVPSVVQLVRKALLVNPGAHGGD